MTNLSPPPQRQAPATGLFGTGSVTDRAALPRPIASPRQRDAFAALFRLEGGSPHLA